MPGEKRRAIDDRFADYLVKAGDDECWGWNTVEATPQRTRQKDSTAEEAVNARIRRR